MHPNMGLHLPRKKRCLFKIFTKNPKGITVVLLISVTSGALCPSQSSLEPTHNFCPCLLPLQGCKIVSSIKRKPGLKQGSRYFFQWRKEVVYYRTDQFGVCAHSLKDPTPQWHAGYRLYTEQNHKTPWVTGLESC